MSIQWGPRPNSEQLSRKSATLGYVLSGVSDGATARALALGYSATLHLSLFRTDVELRKITPDTYHVDVRYGTPDKKEPSAGEFAWTFDTTGETKHVTQGIGNATSYVPGGKTAVNHKRAIGVQDDGSVAGVDVPDRAFKWQEKHQLLLASYGWAYSQYLGANTGKINSGTFRGFGAGTVRFDGAQGGQSSRDPDLLELTYNFVYSPDESSLAVGDITVTSKPGWHYLWVRYQSEEDADAKKTTELPSQVDVVPVLYSFDFATLGIGS